MSLKTQRTINWPTPEQIRDPFVLSFLTDLGRNFSEIFQRLYQDLVLLQGPENVTALPTASSELRGRIVNLKGGLGVADVPSICIKDETDTYVWKKITLV